MAPPPLRLFIGDPSSGGIDLGASGGFEVSKIGPDASGDFEVHVAVCCGVSPRESSLVGEKAVHRVTATMIINPLTKPSE